jgi:hypothetical protein
VNPLADLTDEELWNAQLMLAVACGRSHSSLRKPRRQYFCLLFGNLVDEANQRGVPSPTPPYSVNQIKL